MAAYDEMKSLFGDLVAIAEELGYPASSVCLLSGDEAKLASEFPETYNNLQSCRHNRDARTPMEYGQDLVASWIAEDYLMKSLTDAGLTIEGAGADKNREVLATTKVSSESDCMVSFNGRSRLLEIMNDYKGYWPRYHKVDLRDAKFQKMDKAKSLFLGISTKTKQYILLDFADGITAKFIPRHMPYGFKPAYQIAITENQLIDLDFVNLANEIKSKI